ncbi:O-antigen ligase family protein [Pontibacter silvestris]|nr:O-antigen ligase family protein [Pontibacter silvestris]MCC9135133.1 O-antigen ligase family protein [Pontibacter silvestris]
MSTNGAGGFYSIVTSLAFLFFLNKKTYTNLFLVIFNSFFLYATYSRGSILGLVLGLMALLFIKTRRRYLLYCMFIGLSAIQIYILAYTFPAYKKYIMNSPKANIYQNYNDFAIKEFGARSTKLNNVYIRMYETWPRGLDSFLESPLVGTGFGSVNDVPFHFKQVIPGIITTNEQKNKVFNDSHAHHSFLHLLGEQGLLGVGLFLIFWFSVYNFLLKNNQHAVTRDFLLVSFFNLTIMSFTEHRLTTPSNALPFVIILGLYHVYVNYLKKQDMADKVYTRGMV